MGYADVIKEIDRLTKQAERLRKEEVGSSVKEVKRIVEKYGLRPEDIFSKKDLSKSVVPDSATLKTVKRERKKQTLRGKAPVKYRDASGNTWTGRGLQPRWVRDAIAQGTDLKALMVTGTAQVDA